MRLFKPPMNTNRGSRLIRGLALVVLLVTGILPAQAQAEKGSGKSGVEEDLKLKAGDEKGNVLKALKTEILVMRSEKRALAQIQKLYRRHKGTPMEPEILFRMAELYMRRARTERFFEIHRDSRQVATFAPQMVKDASEKDEIRKAVDIYERLQSKFPSFHSMDFVLFNNAYARLQLGEDEIAERLLTRLIETRPQSGLVPDSYLSIGEINFQKREFKTALENFLAIKNFPKARVYPYGLYKAAWSHYNLQDAATGMKLLEEVIDFGRRAAEQKLDAKLDLRKEALGDMALFSVDVMPADKIVGYLQIQAKDLDPVPYIMRLVELHKIHSRFREVETVLKDVLAKVPASDSVATIHDELVWNYERLKQRSKAVEQLRAFESYCSDVAEGSQAGKSESVASECRRKIADASKKLATKWHATWKKRGGEEDLTESAERAYQIYLGSADRKDTDLPNIRYAFAEYMFARKRYREASLHYAAIEGYLKTSDETKLKVDGKIAHDAAYAAIFSLEKAVDNKWSDDDERRFIELTGLYLERFPKGQYELDLRFRRAFIAYEKERFDEAAPQFQKIGWMKLPTGQPVSDKVAKSQDLYMDILNHKKDYGSLKEAARSLLAITAKSPDNGAQSASQSAARRAQIEKIYREAYFAEIQVLEEKGDLAGAVDAYKKFALENSTAELAAKAWWNASQLQFRMGDATGGANTCYQMHKLFPKSSNGKDCLTQAARTFEDMARLDLSAKVLLNLALVETGQQDKWREVAADFFAMSGEKKRAMVMYMKLAEDRKNSVERVGLLDKAAELAREVGDRGTLASIEQSFTRMSVEPQSSRLVVEQAELAFEKGHMTEAFNLSKRVIGKDGLPKEISARARIVQAKVLEKEYRSQSVKARIERIGLVLAIKTEKLEKAQKAYQSTIRYGDPATSVEALERLAGCYIDYARTVRGMTLPADVPAADQRAFASEIEQLTIPMEEKGIEAMAQALEAARKAQLRDGQIAELQDEINRLNLKAPSGLKVTVREPAVYVPRFTNHIKLGGAL